MNTSRSWRLNEILIELERRTALGPTYVARMMGIAYPTYAHYRSGLREFPGYHARHVELIFSLTDPQLKNWIKEHAYGSS